MILEIFIDEPEYIIPDETSHTSGYVGKLAQDKVQEDQQDLSLTFNATTPTFAFPKGISWEEAMEDTLNERANLLERLADH